MTTAPDGSTPISDDEAAWSRLLELAGTRRIAQPGAEPPQDLMGRDSSLISFYVPLAARAALGSFVVAHLGQSLDGRIATVSGDSQFVTGAADITHNHRMRALFDAIVVGAGTVRADDPRLTVRYVRGDNPLRVVLDTNRSLDTGYRVFSDGEARTVLFCAQDLAGAHDRHGQARVIGVARSGSGIDLPAVGRWLEQSGCGAVFIEGGGVTVSRFLAAGVLHRLQITVAPLILGSGRPGIDLPQINSLAEGTRAPVRHLMLGDDVLFECRLND